MPTTGAARAKELALPRSATITIRNQTPSPDGKVEVAPWTGRVHFANKDDKEYRLRIWKTGTEALEGIDILLPAKGNVCIMIKPKDTYHYGVFHPKGEEKALGKGGGPFTN